MTRPNKSKAIPVQDEEKRFTKEYFSDTFGCDTLKPLSRPWWSVRLYALITRRWLHKIGGKRMLEVGCGYGFVLGMLERDVTTFGVDISSYAILQAGRFAPASRCFVGNIEEGLPESIETDTFDFILARYVLEHLKDPLKAVRRLVARLRPGGLFFFSVPNTESIGARWKGGEWYARKDPTHISLLPPERWREITRQAGLCIRKEFSDGFWDLPYRRNMPIWLQSLVFLGPTVLACATGRDLLPAGFGENVMIIAQKPTQKEGNR